MPLSPSDRALGDLLVARGILTLGRLDEAVALAERWNVRLTDAVLARNWTAPENLYRGLAYHFDLPFVDLIGEPPDAGLLVAAEAETYARALTIPWRRRGDVLLIATAEPGPDTVLFARRRWGPAIEFVVVAKFDIVWTVQTAFARPLSQRAVFELAELDPMLSARRVFTLPQAVAGYALLSAFLAGLAFAPIPTLVALNAATGRTRWVDGSLLTSSQGSFEIQPQVADGRVYLASAYGSGPGGGVLMALNASTVQRRTRPPS